MDNNEKNMLLEIVALEKYSKLREYCGPCRGSGHYHRLESMGEQLVPKNLLCTFCESRGYNLIESQYSLSVIFNSLYPQNKMTTVQKGTNYVSFLGNENDDTDKVVANNSFGSLVERVHKHEFNKRIMKAPSVIVTSRTKVKDILVSKT